jgi:hypothetical protein
VLRVLQTDHAGWLVLKHVHAVLQA